MQWRNTTDKGDSQEDGLLGIDKLEIGGEIEHGES
jgi:hypothetical protein